MKRNLEELLTLPNLDENKPFQNRVVAFKCHSMPRRYPVTTERFIAYFDIMGFKDLVYRTDHSQVSNVMGHVSRVVNMIKASEKGALAGERREGSDYHRGIVMPVLFSDSILFISRSNSTWDVGKVAYAASFFLYAMFDGRIPVKGALAYGRFTANFKKSQFFGRPLIDAYLLAEDTHFYGATVHHSVDEYLHGENYQLPEILMKRKAVPMKGGSVTHSYIDWRIHHKRRRKPPANVLEELSRTVSGSIRRYVDNTRQVYTDVSPSSKNNDIDDLTVG